MNFDPTVTPDDTLMSSANGHGPRVCIFCLRAVGSWHRPSCIVTKERYALAERKSKPARYRYAGLGLLLALAVASGCQNERDTNAENAETATTDAEYIEALEGELLVAYETLAKFCYVNDDSSTGRIIMRRASQLSMVRALGGR